jgi:23S rRNA pseudouridine1911/1915/1917 synthase
MTAGPSTYTVRVDPDKAGSRLDRVLADALPEISRSRLKALIEAGRVAAADAGPVSDPAHRVRPGEHFIVAVPAPPAIGPLPQPLPLDIVYEDEDVIVIDKPPGLVVHPGAGHAEGTLVNALLSYCGRLSGIGEPLRPGIVHRLDKDTSGLLVVAKTEAAHLALAQQFATHRVERAYAAVVAGNPAPAEGRISSAIGRHPRDRTRMAVVRYNGRHAVTLYTTTARYGRVASLLTCRLQTGRTHQIRVHMAAAGHPIIGDATYGPSLRRTPLGPEASAAAAALDRQALHAFLIGFRHPKSGLMLRFVSQLPSDFRRLVRCLEGI